MHCGIMFLSGLMIGFSIGFMLAMLYGWFQNKKKR